MSSPFANFNPTELTRKYMMPLAAAGMGGGLAGLLSSRHVDDENETPSQRRNRILRHSAIGATLAGGAGLIGQMGMNQFDTALPTNDVDPVTSLGKSWGTASAAGAGMAGLMQLGRKGQMVTATQELLPAALTAMRDKSHPTSAINTNMEGVYKLLSKLQDTATNKDEMLATGGQLRSAVGSILSSSDQGLARTRAALEKALATSGLNSFDLHEMGLRDVFTRNKVQHAMGTAASKATNPALKRLLSSDRAVNVAGKGSDLGMRLLQRVADPRWRYAGRSVMGGVLPPAARTAAILAAMAAPGFITDKINGN
jgi:hypothetical protein